jgi:mannitol-specific phosphotransferase system IIBC component
MLPRCTDYPRLEVVCELSLDRMAMPCVGIFILFGMIYELSTETYP